MIKVLAVIVTVISFLAPLRSWAQDSAELDLQALSIYSEVMSPFCPGRLLRDCPSSSAAELKDKIRADLASGKSREVIMTELFSLFGEEMRAEPKASGFGLVAWLAPLIFFLVGGLLWIGWLRSRSTAGQTSDPSPPLSDAMSARIDQELR